MTEDAFDPAYLVTLDEIYHCYWTAKKRRRIDRLRAAVEHFWPGGHPARFVHISGTNGKGSVAHYLEQGLTHAVAPEARKRQHHAPEARKRQHVAPEARKRQHHAPEARKSNIAGSWTGPHLFDYAERLHVGGEQASRAEIVEIHREYLEPYQRSLGQEPLGFPELGILLALHLFARHRVRWGMMESGVGGRYTPLMALPAAACIVTNVGEDHPVTLGDELWQRALEKAGIARPGVPFFTTAAGDALGYVVKTAESQGARVHVVGEEEIEAARRQLFSGEHSGTDPEVANLALARELVRHFYPDREPGAVLSAMRTRLPGRFWSPAPGVIADVAHNRDKIGHFARRLKLEHPGQRFRFLIGLTRRRDPLEIFRPLFELAEEIVVTSASYPGRDPHQIAKVLRREFSPVSVAPDPRAAYRTERERLGDGRMLVLTGSAYMIDQALNPDPYVCHTNASFGWRGRIGERT